MKFPDIWLSFMSETGRAFVMLQRHRLLLRLRVFELAARSAVFWTIALIAGMWLSHWGLSALAWSALAVWVVLSLPALAHQVALILDLLNYAITRRILFYPFFEAVERSIPPRERVQPLGFVWGLVRLAMITSPLMGVATWCYAVLIRLPESTHVTIAPAAARAPRSAHHGNNSNATVSGHSPAWDRTSGAYWEVLRNRRTISDKAPV